MNGRKTCRLDGHASRDAQLRVLQPSTGPAWSLCWALLRAFEIPMRYAQSQCAGRPVRVHRGVLQPESPPLHAGLQLADLVPGELDQQACGSANQGGMRAALWKTKFDGHLKAQQESGAQGCGSDRPATRRQGLATAALAAPVWPHRQGAVRSTVALDEEGPASVQQCAALARLGVPGALRGCMRVVSLQEFNQDTDKESIRRRKRGRAAFRGSGRLPPRQTRRPVASGQRPCYELAHLRRRTAVAPNTPESNSRSDVGSGTAVTGLPTMSPLKTYGGDARLQLSLAQTEVKPESGVMPPAPVRAGSKNKTRRRWWVRSGSPKLSMSVSSEASTLRLPMATSLVSKLASCRGDWMATSENVVVTSSKTNDPINLRPSRSRIAS